MNIFVEVLFKTVEDEAVSDLGNDDVKNESDGADRE